MSKVEIYYFTGSGNSLHAARELQKRIPDASIIPMVSLLNKDVIETRGETVGFVFPIYTAAAPLPVRSFISKLDLTSAKYVFAIATRIGTTHGAFEIIDGILSKKGRRLDSYFSLNMPSNDVKFSYKALTEEEISKLEADVQDRLDLIQGFIVYKEKSREKDTSFTMRIPFVKLLSKFVTLTKSMKYNLYADSKCTGCGTCEKVCPSGKIKMTDGKPLWKDSIRCYNCSACLNFCPMQASQIKSQTEKNGRYYHPYATADDIVGQKGAII